MFKFQQATKATKISQKTNRPSVPYVEVHKDGASATAIQWFLKGGSRQILQGDKIEENQTQFVTFAFCSDTSTIAFKILKNKIEYDKEEEKGNECRELKAGVNINGGYGCSCLKKSIKKTDGLDFTKMDTVYSGILSKIENPKDCSGYQYSATLKKVE